MNTLNLRLFFLIITLGFKSFSQNDSIIQNQGKKAFGGIPILSYDADIGLRYGLVFNYFKYKDSSSLRYEKNFFIRGFNTTKGSTQIQSIFETNKLYGKTRAILETTFQNDKKYDFFGFNGTETRYNLNHQNIDHPDYLNTYFYSIQRKLFRIRADLFHPILRKNLYLLTGFTYNNIQIQSDQNQSDLFGKYSMMNLIPSSEQKGGTVSYLSLGIVFDNRNNQCHCSEGKWIETYFVLAPSHINSRSFSKFIFNYRNYIKLNKKGIILMTRLSLQAKTSGSIPSYFQSVYFDTRTNQDGLGGAFNLRGYNRNRIVSNGYTLLNIEIRKKMVEMKIRKTKLQIESSIFSDNALILQKNNFSNQQIPSEYEQRLFNFDQASSYYSSIGTGVYMILNKSSIISFNYGLPLINEKMKKGAFYIGSSFLF